MPMFDKEVNEVLADLVAGKFFCSYNLRNVENDWRIINEECRMMNAE